jgi:hypothetical protein
MFVRVVLALALLTSGTAWAEQGVCHVVDVQLQPQKRTDLRPGMQMPPQIVVWVEDADGTFIDTVFITQKTGTYGLGNRPGRADFNSAPLWPYGKRITTFPVWADKKPERFDAIIFQDGAENNLSHRVEESSLDPFYCRPMQPIGPDGVKFDAMTCASPNTTHTDKGIRSNIMTSKYPPRQDMTRAAEDAADVDTFPAMNPYDAVSAATPPTGELANFNWPILGRPPGDYVMWVEVSTEFDHNATYSTARFPGPAGIPWGEYGEPFRGQPSLVFRVPFTISSEELITQTATYVGYGDPEGVDGTIRPPDATITETLLGSGLGRLALVTDQHGEFRVRVTTRPELDLVKPNAPTQLVATDLRARRVSLSFVAPGDDAVAGTVRGYEIRYRVGSPVTEDNFDDTDSIVVPSSIMPLPAGSLQELELEGLFPETTYFVGIRAYDDCRSAGPIASLEFTTSERMSGEVDACFIATAAYGSALASDVAMLRGVRDSLLRKTVLGELFVQAYYTFGPPLAGVVGESELLRATARAALRPVVDFVGRHAPAR